MNPITIFYIVRTQGKRPILLDEAIRSIHQQAFNKRIIVVNHSLNLVDLDHLRNLDVITLKDLNKKRGAPLNLGLEKVFAEAGPSDCVAFLDDDDIFYANFANDLVKVLNSTGVDFVYGKTKRKVGNQNPVFAFEKKPDFELLINNFIPINGFLIKISSLKSIELVFDDTMDFLEDWKFLVSLYLAGLKIEYCNTFVSEHRVHEDGTNSLTTDTSRRWKECEADIESYIKSNFSKISAEDFYKFVYSLRERREILYVHQTAKIVELKLSARIRNKIVRNLKKIF